MPFLLGAALTLTNASAEISIAIVDSDFCPKPSTNKIHLNKIIDTTSSNKSKCNPDKIFLPRFHGQWVLNEFIKYYVGTEKIIITPIEIFNSDGIQKKEYWDKAISFIQKNKFDYVLTASGLKDESITPRSLPSMWFIAAGQITTSIKISDHLFPQELTSENLVLIGDYHQGNPDFYDQSLLYQDKIKYYFPAGDGEFKGSSRAVAEALSKAISYCGKKPTTCLEKKATIKTDPVLKKSFKTF